MSAPTSGRLVDGAHVLALRIYYEDTDAAGIVYYANYLKFAERARTDWLRALGMPHSQMIKRDGLTLVVRRCEAENNIRNELPENRRVSRTRISRPLRRAGS